MFPADIRFVIQPSSDYQTTKLAVAWAIVLSSLPDGKMPGHEDLAKRVWETLRALDGQAPTEPKN